MNCKPDYPSFIPRTHGERKETLDLPMCTMHVYNTQTHTQYLFDYILHEFYNEM